MNMLLRNFFYAVGFTILLSLSVLDAPDTQFADLVRVVQSPKLIQMALVLTAILIALDGLLGQPTSIHVSHVSSASALGVKSSDEKDCSPLFFGNAKQMARVREILGFSGGGVHKRIDENRELLELLQQEAPELLAKNFWIEGWLKGHDEFFSDLEAAVPIQKGRFLFAMKMMSHRPFPRPWPGEPAPDVVPVDAQMDGAGR